MEFADASIDSDDFVEQNSMISDGDISDKRSISSTSIESSLLSSSCQSFSSLFSNNDGSSASINEIIFANDSQQISIESVSLKTFGIDRSIIKNYDIETRQSPEPIDKSIITEENTSYQSVEDHNNHIDIINKDDFGSKCGLTQLIDDISIAMKMITSSRHLKSNQILSNFIVFIFSIVIWETIKAFNRIV